MLNSLKIIPPSLFDIESDFWSVFHQQVEQFSERISVKSTQTALTFSELNQKANNIAVEITENGKPQKNGVALYLNDGGKLATALLGVLKSQNFIVPLDPSFPTQRLEYMLEDSAIKIILTDDKHFKKALDLSGQSYSVINIDELDNKHILPNPILHVAPDDITQIVYTSGTTGDPKGVVVTYRYYYRAIKHHLETGQTQFGDRIGNLTSFNFLGPYTHLMACLLTGASFHTYNLKNDGLPGLKEWVKDEKLTYFSITPAVFRKFSNSLCPNEKFSDVRIFSLGAEKKLIQDFLAFRQHFLPDCEMILKFVSTETYYVTYHRFKYDHNFEGDVLPAGYPVDDIDLYIWDEDGKEVAKGEIGEIVVRGDSFARGYWHQPELTRQKFLSDPSDPRKTIFRTGDLGKILPDGQLQHMGRMDDLVKIKGIRIELASIENHILQYPGVVQAAARAFEDGNNTQKLAAYFVPDEGVNIAKSDLRKFLADRLPLQMLPNYLVELETIPLTGSNKIDRKALPVPELKRPALDNPYQAARDELEGHLVKIWEENIGIQGIGVTDNYFELGGDSLSGVLLFVQIEQVFKRRLPVSILLTHPTIEQLVEVLEKVDIDADWSPTVKLRGGDELAPVIFIPGKGSYPTRFQYLAKILRCKNPLYALQASGVGKGRRPYYTVEEMASNYVEEIKKIVPRGPYHLCGESGGGTVAYEMAQQLRQKGEQVPVLVMFDTFGPEQTGMLQFPKTRRARLAYNLMLLRKHLQIIWESSWEGRRAYVELYWQRVKDNLASRRQKKELEKELGGQSAIPLEIRRAERAHIEAMRKYVPQAYPGRVILFRAQRNPASIDATNGWDKVELGELIVHNLDCYHGNILFEPAVNEVAKNLDDYLSKT